MLEFILKIITPIFFKNSVKVISDRGPSAINKLYERWKNINWEKYAKKYCQRIKHKYGSMQVLGMSEAVPLEEIFTDVKILGQLSSTKQVFDDKMDLAQETFLKNKGFIETSILGKSERRSGLEIVEDDKYMRIFILGKPGAGKTTFLKYVTLKLVNGDLNTLPIFINLREFSESNLDFFDYLSKEFEICGFPKADKVIIHLLEYGKTVLVLDGLDEVNKINQQRDNIIKTIRRVAIQYPNTKIILTCRIAANEYTFEGFHYIEMADFDEKQIHSFVEKWFKKHPDNIDNFFKELDKDHGLKEMAQSPLLLVLLCLVFEDNMEFPAVRSSLYKAAIDTLLRRWDISRQIKRDEIFPVLTQDRIFEMFCEIAAENFVKMSFLFPQNELERSIFMYLQKLPGGGMLKPIYGEFVLKKIEAYYGIFVERAYEIYSFSHLTLQEYFTAKYIAGKGRQSWENLVHNFNKDQWQQVIILTAQCLSDGQEFISYCDSIVKENLFEIEETSSKEFLKKFFKLINKKVDSLDSKYSKKVSRGFYLWLFFIYEYQRQNNNDENLTIFRELISLVQEIVSDINPDVAFFMSLDLNLDNYISNNANQEEPNLSSFINIKDLDLELDLDRTLIALVEKLNDLKSTPNFDNEKISFKELTIDDDLEEEYKKLYQGIDQACKKAEDIIIENASKMQNENNDYQYKIIKNKIRHCKLIYNKAVFLSEKLDNVDLTQRLNSLPSIQFDLLKNIDVIIRNLIFILQSERNIGFEIEAIVKIKTPLQQYFRSTKLLNECIDVAVLNNRDLISNNIILNPFRENLAKS